MFCMKCGKELPDDAVFCDKCGANQQKIGMNGADTTNINENGNKKVKPMMKYLIIAEIIIALVIVIFIAVIVLRKNVKDDSEEIASTVVQNVEERSPDLDYENSEINTATSEEIQSEENEDDNTGHGLELCEPSKEWNELSATDMAIQLCDVVLYSGYSVADTVAMLEKSNYYEKMESDYNPNRMVPANGWEAVQFKCKISDTDSVGFSFTAQNYTDDTAEMKDLVVTSVNIPSELYPYCRFIDGRSYDDIMTMTYQDAKSLDCMKDLSMKEDEYMSVIYNIDVLSAIPAKRTQWTFYDYWISANYVFYIDRDTATVKDFKAWGELTQGPKSKGEKLTSLDKLSNDDIRNLIEAGKEAFMEEYHSENVTFGDVYNTIYLVDANESTITVFIDYLNNDGENKTACIKFAYVGIQYNGALTYGMIYTSSEDSIDDAYGSISWGATVLDERNISDVL